MTKIITVIFLFIFCFPCKAQDFNEKILNKKNNEKKIAIGDSNKNYKLFEGKIIEIDENTFLFDEEVLFVYNTSKELKRIFLKGIFHPEIVTGPLSKGILRKQELDSMLIRNDSLRITDFKELKNYYKTPTERKFIFWLFYKRLANPTEYFIILRNENATLETDIEGFINGARLIKIEKGTLII